MPKERTINPATAALKASKARTIKKSRAAVAAQRAERNVHRDPGRLERRIADLQARREASKHGKLPAAEEKALADLERDLGRVRRARERAGVEDGGRGAGGGRGARGGEGRGGGAAAGGVLGKRRRDGSHAAVEDRPAPAGADGSGSDASDTDADARDIPMPRDHEHEPPVPSRRRRHLRNGPPLPSSHAGPHALPAKPPATSTSTPNSAPPREQKTVYAAAPQLRDLQKEAVKRFVPAAVASKLAAVRGEGGRLVEPEEADRLEREGYIAPSAGARADAKVADGKAAPDEDPGDGGPGTAAAEDADADDALEKLEEEERRFREETRLQRQTLHVQIEEVEDEDL
jgi:hypothetical protein